MKTDSDKLTRRNCVEPLGLLSANRQRNRGAFVLLGLGLSVFASTGCALLIGTEKREEEVVLEGEALIEDTETQIFTTPLCIKYCDEVMDNCTGDNQVYKARASCINTCNALPEGEAAEPVGNSVQCRMSSARKAASAPDEECIAAGPGGGTTCGSNCESWCQLLETECPDDFADLPNCENACATIPDEGEFSVDASYSRDDIQCRLIHLGAVQGDPTSPHCGHARYIAKELCVPAEAGEPSCENYCNRVMGNCSTDATAVYESHDDCLATCEALPPGDLSDRDTNTAGCREYHASAAALTPTTHCHHSGPTGDGQCGKTSQGTGNCESYCSLYEVACGAEFEREFSNLEACKTRCETDFRNMGAQKDSKYAVNLARDTDSLQCRMSYVVRALGGHDASCEKALTSGICN